MLTKPEFLDALARETRILTHLAKQLQPQHLEFRFTPPQRSTLELLQYLAIHSQASVQWFLAGNWDHWDALEAQGKAVTLESFPKALKAQDRAIAKLLAPIGERAWKSKPVKLPSGGRGTLPLGQALFEVTLTQAIGYRMQLFLQAKAAGLAHLNSYDLWLGKRGTPKE
ncbi:MAG: hypothetical protein RMM29_08825 [Planctomycetota bacterium]|nr:hypothetical protein [Planctomycetota bacterium]MCX8040748.1 hypothetical protein [Planctomycetota bacterium]MDW8373730.1 hypothetical protein [Planctomycetota bacterium]